MSEHSKPEAGQAEGQPKPSGSGGIVPWIAVGVISAGLGSAMPFLLAGQSHAGADEDSDSSDQHPSGKSLPRVSNTEKRVRTFTLPKEEETVFLPFGTPGKDQEVVVNLDEGRMSRYLRVAVTLQVPKSQELSFKTKVDAKKILLRNWLLSKISDLDLEDIRGAAGQNRLRREIRDHFNSVLCPDGYDQIYDVLFEEFNVQ